MDGLTKALARSRGVADLAYHGALRMKDAGVLNVTSGMGQMSMFGNASKSRRSYALNHGWVYSAVHALSSEAAGQPVQVGKMLGVEPEEERGRKPSGRKDRSAWSKSKMTKSARSKAAQQEMDVLLSHPLLDALERPNPIQRRFQFVYSFVANLNFTGWSYVVHDVSEDGKMEFYSLPTTWVKPSHEKGPFSEFRIVNPRDPQSQADREPLTRDQVAFAYLPNPSDPLSAISPAEAQMMSIKIDDHIQTSQERFFENGVFPSVIVTVGKDPHPDVPAGIRPRLTAAQRRQVHGAVSKTMRGVANYGNPAIVDGMIESIERLSMGQNEMGWDRSEQSARTRILSAFGVHPYILGEPVSVGGYAQAAKIEERFCKRVNTFLDMLGNVMTSFAGPLASVEDDLIVWWEECEPHDPSLHWQNIRHARDRDDITQNEYRSMLGLPPDEDRNESVIGRQAAQVVQLLGAVGSGAVDREQAMGFLIGLGLPDDLADRIAGKEKVIEEPSAPPEEETVQQATEALQEATSFLRLDPQKMVDQIEEAFKGHQDQPRVPSGPEGGQWGPIGGSWSPSSGGGGGGGWQQPSGGGGGSETKPEAKPESKPSPEFGSSEYDKQHEEWLEGLSPMEKESIIDYTVDRYNDIRNCQNRGVGCDKRTKEEISSIKSAMDKAPKYEGTTYRGLEFETSDERADFVAKVVKNDGLVDKGFMSTTRSKEIAEDFATANERSGVVLRIKSKKGVDIQKLSPEFEEEQEILLGPGSKLKYTSMKKSGGKVVITLEEQ